MKKISFALALATMASLALSSCGEKKIDKLESENDSLSYAYAVGYGKHISENYLNGETSGANYDALMKGLDDGIASKDTSINYYALGLNIGAALAKDAKDGIMGDSTLTLNLDIIKSAIKASINKEDLIIDAEKAGMMLQTIVEAKQAAEAEKQFGENKKKGELFLAQNAKRTGVITTASGLQYEILKAGKGPKPSLNDKVKVHYVGTLIDGTEFDSSIKRNEPAVFPVNAVIKGWSEAMQLMPVGSKWKLYIPQELAYGSRSQNPIPPFSALVFEVELLSIEK